VYDIKLVNARVLDGAGAPWFRADVAVKDGFIAKVGRVDEEARKTIDASGKYVCPGFIDAHSHSDLALVVNPTADSKIMQGVTLEVIGQCGSSGAPRNLGLRDEMDETSREAGENVPPWTDMASYLDVLESQGTSLNVAALVGHGSVRRQVMGTERRAPTPTELETMKRLVAQAMEQGAFGMSSGLIYVPGTFSKTDEVIDLANVTAEYGGIYFTHIRNESSKLLEALKEAIQIGFAADIPVQISHFKVMGKPYWGMVKESIAMVEKAREDGLDITADQYPYIASSTGLSSSLANGGLERLKDPAERAKVLDSLRKRENWDKIQIASLSNPDDLQFLGKTIQEVAGIQGIHPEEAALGLLERNRGVVQIVNFAMCEDDVKTVMAQPWIMAGSDGRAFNAATPQGQPHPRSYGTFVRILGKYVREEKLLRLEEAVRKMTSLPAARLGLQDRGILREGLRADLVMFNAATVRDNATFTAPHQYPSGIDYVLVNGQIVVEEGKHNGERPGLVLRHRR